VVLGLDMGFCWGFWEGNFVTGCKCYSFGCFAAHGQTADSSASLRNDKQKAAAMTDKKARGKDKQRRLHPGAKQEAATILLRGLPRLDCFVRSRRFSWGGSSLLVLFRVRWRSGRK